jgi:hypothetical protein
MDTEPGRVIVRADEVDQGPLFDGLGAQRIGWVARDGDSAQRIQRVCEAVSQADQPPLDSKEWTHRVIDSLNATDVLRQLGSLEEPELRGSPEALHVLGNGLVDYLKSQQKRDARSVPLVGDEEGPVQKEEVQAHEGGVQEHGGGHPRA